MPLADEVRKALRRAGTPERAVQQQAYMRSTLPFYGVRLPEVRHISRSALRAHPLLDAKALEAVIEELWDNATHREEWYAALSILMAPAHRTFRSSEFLPLYERLIVSGAWWDVVDDIASHAVREQLLTDPARVTPTVRRWATSDGLWLRRAALVCQIGAKKRTDVKLLTYVIERNMADRDFFMRKGIGWALRDYSKSDASWVRHFIDSHRDAMSPLSLREAGKYI